MIDMARFELIVSFAVFCLILIGVSLIPPIIGRKRYRVTWWDFVFPFLGAPLWFILTAIGVGNEVSSTNFAFEIFLIMLSSAMVPWIRYYLAYSRAWYVPFISFYITFLPVTFTVCLRMFLPLLPE